MRHARPEDLDRIDSLLASVRALDGLTEKKRGTFYRRSQAFLHFHEHAGAIIADLKVDGDWQRHDVTGAAGQHTLLTAVGAQLAR